MIKDLILKFGSHPESNSLLVETTPVTVFVGPNNSGKSKLLTEIQQYCQGGVQNHTFKLIDDISFSEFNEEQISKEIKKHTLKPNFNETINQGNILFGNGIARNQVPNNFPTQILSSPNSQKQNFCTHYLSYKTLKLDALNRITLINPQPLGDMQTHPSNNLSILFSDDEKRLEVRRIIYDAFELYFVLDPTNSGNLRIRLSKIKPENHQLGKIRGQVFHEIRGQNSGSGLSLCIKPETLFVDMRKTGPGLSMPH